MRLCKDIASLNERLGRAQYILCVDESGNRDVRHVDPHWPILSLFGALVRRSEYAAFASRLDALKKALWPPEGTYVYKAGNKEVARKVCFHSHEMRRREGPFSESALSPDVRQNMDDTLWNIILSGSEWRGLSCIIDKGRLRGRYAYPDDPYNLAVTFMLERVVMNSTGKVAVIFEARGKGEDKRLRDHVYMIVQRGTPYIAADKFQRCIDVVRWVPKYDQSGDTICGLEVADLCAYVLGAYYIKASPSRYAKAVWSKLIGYDPNDDRAAFGRGHKVFP